MATRWSPRRHCAVLCAPIRPNPRSRRSSAGSKAPSPVGREGWECAIGGRTRGIGGVLSRRIPSLVLDVVAGPGLALDADNDSVVGDTAARRRDRYGHLVPKSRRARDLVNHEVEAGLNTAQ